ncbi:tRNA pseudouridine(55) synthase TruB [uncultured Algimonas sp.]|uniref:tRNA pseudouridine(55) synthase TruB n=1 Tax=uncultured Algimonas sp. TaxID=1547920 RepID=UPI0034508C55
MDPNGRNRRKRGRPIHGWVVLDKPLGLGSTKAVAAVRRLMDAQKAGHAGTLDPLATGLLPIALGEATKTVPFLMDAPKSYDFDIAFGTSTETLDAEGAVTGASDVRPTRAQIEAVLPRFVGAVEQVPPKYSAIRIDGKRAYDLARAGAAVEMKTRTVRIDALRLVSHDGDGVSLLVDCGKGTYVRSLARDICVATGAEGHISRLRRTRVGPFGLAQSLTLDALAELCDGARADEGCLPLSTALDDIPVLAVTDPQAIHLKQGRAIAAPQSLQTSAPHDREWILAEAEGSPVALCQPRDGRLWPKRVFNI